MLSFYSYSAVAGQNIEKYSLIAQSSKEKTLEIRQKSGKEKEPQELNNLIQERADSICKTLFKSQQGARSFLLKKDHFGPAYFHEDIENQNPIPVEKKARHRKGSKKEYKKIPHTIFTEISCRTDDSERSLQDQCEVSSKLDPAGSLEHDVSAIIELDASESDKKLKTPLTFNEFCNLLSQEPFNCTIENVKWVKNAYQRLANALETNPDSSESVKAGFILYLNDLSKQEKSIQSTGFKALFFPKKRKSIGTKKVMFLDLPVLKTEEDQYTILDPEAVRPDEAAFFSKLERKRYPPVLGKERTIEAARGFIGESGSTIRVESEQGQNYYFKRFAVNHKKTPDQTLIGKKMAAEVGAYLLSGLMGYDLVPKTEFGTYKSKSGSLQASVPESFIQAAKLDEDEKKGSANELFRSRSFKEEKSNLQVLYYLGSFVDGHKGNIFLDPKNSKLKSIDHESGFHYPVPFVRRDPMYMARGTLPGEYTPQTRSRIATLTFDKVQETFDGILTPDQMDSVWLRVNILKADIVRKYGRLSPDQEY
jgi:hypothetical protein